MSLLLVPALHREHEVMSLKEEPFVPEHSSQPAPSEPWVARPCPTRPPSRGMMSNPLGGWNHPGILPASLGRTRWQTPGSRHSHFPQEGRAASSTPFPFPVNPGDWMQLCSFSPVLSVQSGSLHFDLQRPRLLMWKLFVLINDLLLVLICSTFVHFQDATWAPSLLKQQ